jgi:hypothetical protein
MVVHHSKAADTHREDFGELFNPAFNPQLTIKRLFAQ